MARGWHTCQVDSKPSDLGRQQEAKIGRITIEGINSGLAFLGIYLVHAEQQKI
jgi:hypothetical protein